MKHSFRNSIVSTLLLVVFVSTSVALPFSTIYAQQKVSENYIYKSARACLKSAGVSIFIKGIATGLAWATNAIFPPADATGGISSDVGLRYQGILKQIKESCLSPAVKMLAREMVARATSNIIGWIQQGAPNGTSLVVSNRSAFLSRLANIEINHYVNELNARNPYGQIVVKNIADQYGFSFDMYGPTLSERALDRIFGGNELFGWESYIEATRPQNNPIGIYLLYRETVSNTIGVQQEVASKEVDWSGGFQPVKECIEWSKTTTKKDHANRKQGWLNADGSWIDDQEAGPLIEGAYYGKYTPIVQVTNTGTPGVDFPCDEWKVNTPGTIVVDQLSNVLGSQIRQTELADDFDKDLSLIIGALLDRFVLSFLDEGVNTLGGELQREFNSESGRKFNPSFGTSEGVQNPSGSGEELEIATIDQWIQTQKNYITASENQKKAAIAKWDSFMSVNTCFPLPRKNWQEDWDQRKENVFNSEAIFGLQDQLGITGWNVFDQIINRIYGEYSRLAAEKESSTYNPYYSKLSPANKQKADNIYALTLLFKQLETEFINVEANHQDTVDFVNKNIDQLKLIKAQSINGFDAEIIETKLATLGPDLYSNDDIKKLDFTVAEINFEKGIYDNSLIECQSIFANYPYPSERKVGYIGVWSEGDPEFYGAHGGSDIDISGDKDARAEERYNTFLGGNKNLGGQAYQFEFFMGIRKATTEFEKTLARMGQQL